VKEEEGKEEGKQETNKDRVFFTKYQLQHQYM